MEKTKITSSPSASIILAAGMGKRMKSELPKVLHEVCGEPMLIHVLRCVTAATPEASIGIVVGHGKEKIIELVTNHPEFKERAKNRLIEFLVQPEQKGTGHAVRCAIETPWGEKLIQKQATVLVLPGDLPLIPLSLVLEMSAPVTKAQGLRALTCELSDPTGYGRVIRARGKLQKIVEEKDSNATQKKINEVVASIYAFHAEFLKKELPKLKTKNIQGEYYLTDLVESASRAKKKIQTLIWKKEEDLRGVNDLWELSLAERIFQLRLVERHARNGVRFTDPYSVAIEAQVEIQAGVKIHRGVVLRGKTRIGQGADIGSNCVLRNTIVGEGVQMKAGCYCEDSEISDEVKIGPYANLRPESFIGRASKIGNFVELKKTRIGEETSVAHLSYLGDAEVGSRVNIGCGFITCNFDGRVVNGSRKHKTTIGDDCFIGSDVQMVAPIEIHEGAYIASGSTITKDVEANALGIARARQENKQGYASRLRGMSQSRKGS